MPLSSAANNSVLAFSCSFCRRSELESRPGKRGSSPKPNVSYIVTPKDHTSDRVENFPSLILSGAYLKRKRILLKFKEYIIYNNLLHL